MEIHLLVIPDCPNSRPAQELLETALELEDIADVLVVREIATQEEADALVFHGSPSFSINGADIFDSVASPAVACRVYRAPNGMAGLPTLGDLRQAIRTAVAVPEPTS